MNGRKIGGGLGSVRTSNIGMGVASKNEEKIDRSSDVSNHTKNAFMSQTD